MIRPFITELNAAPPAKHRFCSPVRAWSVRSRRRTVSSRTSWALAAMSLWRWPDLLVGPARRPELADHLVAELIALGEVVVEHPDVHAKRVRPVLHEDPVGQK
jgi:hypothetical protein